MFDPSFAYNEFLFVDESFPFVAKSSKSSDKLLINNLAQIFFLINGTCASSGSGGVGITMLHFF